MNRTRFFGLLAGAAATAVAAVPAFADDGEKGLEKALDASEKRSEKAREKLETLAKRVRARAGMGEIKSIGANATFVLTTRRGDVTVTTDDETTYHQGREKDLTFADLKVGQRVVVQVVRADTDANATTVLARRVILLPEKKERPQRTVTVGVINGLPASGAITGFTVTPQGGSAVTFVANADTQYHLHGVMLANGATVRVVSKQDGANNVALRVRVPAGD